MAKKILIIYTSAGLGHKSMAENIGSQLSAGGYEIKYLDVFEAEDGKLIAAGRVLHKFINQTAPWLWRFFYTNRWFIKHSLKYRTKIASKNCLNTKKIIDEFKPDVIITTQAAASGVVAYLKQKNMYKGLFGIAFSDFHLHEYWLYEQAEFYLVNIKEQKEQMTTLGLPPKKIFICGMSLPNTPVIDSRQIRNKFNIQPEEKVVLISSGSLGLGLNKKLIENLSQTPKVKVIVVCGKNVQIFNKLNHEFSSTSVSIQGYYKPMTELYSIADIFVSKPGGLSVAEALQFKLPILIEHMLPGQEEINFNYLQNQNLVMPRALNTIDSIVQELKTKSFKKVLQQNPNLSALLMGEIKAVDAINKVLAEYS